MAQAHEHRTEDRQPVPETDPRIDQVRIRAYHLWEAAGRPAGQDVQFWMRAEREIMGSDAPSP